MLRLAIVGAGIMGANHARVARQLRDAQVTYIVDANQERAQALAAASGAQWTTRLDDVYGHVDAAVVAVPTELHASVSLQLVRGGVHVLVEKPIACDADDAKQLVEAAADHQVTLQVGHVERFNPAVLELDHLLDRLVHIDIVRVSPYSPRIRDGVVSDLMIHDLDLALALTGSEVAHASAVTRSTRSTSEDLASALLVFENGVTASLTASRIGQNKIRNLSLTQAQNYVSVDMLRQDVTVCRVDHSEYLSDEGARYRQTGVVELPFLEYRGEPLSIQLAHFVAAVLEGKAPRVSGTDGLRALELALRIRDVAVDA